MSRWFFVLIALSLVSLGTGLFLVLRPVIYSSRASGSPSPYSLNHSYLFASPIQAKADGQEKIRITVFLLDQRGLGVSQKTISLSAPASLTQQNQQPVTNDVGQAQFDLSTDTPGSYHISAQVDGQTLPQTVKILFTE